MNNIKKGATISECGFYRYELWRFWDELKPKLLFIMLNPSTADSELDDPTIRRCIGFAKKWGYGGFYVGNLFAFRSKKPTDLLNEENPYGDFNNYYLSEMANKCSVAVCAWGNFPVLKKMGISPTLDNIHIPKKYIDLSINGTPKHPLYLKKELELKPLLWL